MRHMQMFVASTLMVFCSLVIATPLDCVTITRLEATGNYRGVLSLCTDDNSAKSLCIRGDYYYHGRKGIPVYRARGLELYKRALEKLLPAAEAGDADAQYWTARCLEYGACDMNEARKWYMKAADAGNSKAMLKAAWFSVRRFGAAGMGFTEAREAALHYAKAASKAGNADGTALMAWLTFIDCRGERNFEKALPAINESVEGDSPLGKMLLGRIYEEGSVVKQDLERVERLLQEAVDQGYSDARDILEEVKKQRVKDRVCRTTSKTELGDPTFGMSASDVKAKKGAELYERQETRKEGLAILRKAASEGSPIALARLSALFYLGEGGVRQDYDKALKLMKSAVSKGFPASLLPIKEAETACKRAKESKAKVSVQPGDGYPGSLDPYSVNRNLKHQLDRFNLKAGWFRRDTHAESMLNPQEKEKLLANELPYLLFTPRRSTKPVPMLVYFGGTGEQGTDLIAHLNQTTIFSEITSPEFQEKHPCYLFALSGANVGIFFTFWGLSVLRKNPDPVLRRSLVSRMFGWMLPKGAEKLVLSKMNMLGLGTAMMKDVMSQAEHHYAPVAHQVRE